MKNPNVMHFSFKQPELFPIPDLEEKVNDELIRYENADVSEIL